ncbi:MAG: ferredoxin [Candidatus Omnitrophica bacterium]|nr:ferredoxin [Candidatus Omnitrophota bacterium]
MRAKVDQETCTGCGACASTCPDVFKMEGDKATAYNNPVPEGAEEKCKEAEAGCPVDAITCEE